MEFANKLVELAQSNALMLVYLSEKNLIDDFTEWQNKKLKNLIYYSEKVKAIQEEIMETIN
jgi:peptide subunit release factor 1 (eRF1)